MDFEGIEFPVRVSDINQFEQQNPRISVNVYIYQLEFNPFCEFYKNELQPLRITKNLPENHINLLLLVKFPNERAAERKEDGSMGTEIGINFIRDKTEQNRFTAEGHVRILRGKRVKKQKKNELSRRYKKVCKINQIVSVAVFSFQIHSRNRAEKLKKHVVV